MSRVEASQMSAGGTFQRVRAATLRALSLKVHSLVWGMECRRFPDGEVQMGEGMMGFASEKEDFVVDCSTEIYSIIMYYYYKYNACHIKLQLSHVPQGRVLQYKSGD